MSQVWVRLDEAQRGSLPARCARTGQRCITRYARPLADLPATTEWITWTGLWPRGRDAEATTVVLPLLPSRHRAGVVLRRTRDVTAALLGLAAIAVLLGGGVVDRVAAAVAVVAAVLHVLVAAVGLLATVDVRSDHTGRWVRLSHVHPDFVAATEAVTTRPAAEPTLEPGAPRADAVSEPAGER